MAGDFTFARRGRAPRTLGIVIAIYTGLVAAILLIDAAWWLMAALALATLPALWDLWQDPSAGVRLNDTQLEWHTGRHCGTLAWDEIDHMRIDTRWDFSVRVTAMLQSGKRVRLPYQALPPHRALEAALLARGVLVERHHFRVF